ncbi:hypothetical protein MUK42_19616 [Musa troglodytarum]|uniref:Uncharacterized protein n=1 Tax=Musa troglodytarum TaxID=320322 RepID=A0A9E7K3Z7_9LILI|nr:hypothetical protein MUK42_19616 [Musa troglodytarum]
MQTPTSSNCNCRAPKLLDRVGAEEAAAAVAVRRQAERVNQAARGQSPVSKTYLEDPIPCRASNGHVLNYHQTGFDEECERFFSQIYKYQHMSVVFTLHEASNSSKRVISFCIDGDFNLVLCNKSKKEVERINQEKYKQVIVQRGRKFAISFCIHWRLEQALLPWKPEEKGSNR